MTRGHEEESRRVKDLKSGSFCSANSLHFSVLNVERILLFFKGHR